MREILFRGKDFSGVLNNQWLYGALDNTDKDNPKIVYVDRFGNRCCVRVATETVGQFTGLCDANGAKIFEGDLLESRISENPEDWKIWRVGFEDGTFTFESVRKSVKSRRKYRYEINMICVDEVKFYGLVLIGNIHDNPELLEGNK